MGNGCSNERTGLSVQASTETLGYNNTHTPRRSSLHANPKASLGEADLEVKVTAVSLSELQSQLEKWVLQRKDEEDRRAFSKTLQKSIEVLAGGIGGAIIVVLHEEIIKQDLFDFSCLDGGVFHAAMKSMVTNINKSPDAFKTVLEVLSAHTESDRWEQENLVQLVDALPSAAQVIPSLAGQPKDGAILISHLGEIHGATLQLKAQGIKSAILKKANGTAAGTRHNSSLSAACWLSDGEQVRGLELQTPGVVITRSDAGGAHCFIPQLSETSAPVGLPPTVLHFETIHHLSQEEMLNHFGEKIKRDGSLMKKKLPALGRLGINGETVVSIVGGRKTSEMTVDGDKTHMVLRAATPDQEHYVLPMDKFNRLYIKAGIELDELDGADSSGPFMQDQIRQLKAKGFKLYEPRPDNRRYIYKLVKSDFEILKTNAFISGWGAVQPVKDSDYLASPENGAEIYLMPEEVVKSGYSECDTSQGHAQLKRLGSRSGQDTAAIKVWSQKNMLDKYKEMIKEKGELRIKRGTVLMREANGDETVVTCINGRVTASTLVTDDDSKVVQGDLHELYVLSKVKVEENYETRVYEIPGNEAMDELFRSQGFKVYTPKKKPKFFYKIEDEDMKTMPNAFQTAFGNVHGPEVGDYLVMPDVSAGEGNARPEIYMMPQDKAISYRAIDNNRRTTASGVRALSPALGHHSTREFIKSTMWNQFPWAWAQRSTATPRSGTGSGATNSATASTPSSVAS